MTRIGFAFLAVSMLTFAMFSGGDGVGVEYQLLISLGLIAFVGIPHGAIDHVLYLKEAKDKGPARFYAGYLGTLLLYLVLWIFFPRVSLALFLFVSAFHFGQSQLVDKVVGLSIWKNVLSFFWGASILSGLVVYNHSEIVYFSSQEYDLAYLLPVFNLTIHKLILYISSGLVLGSFVLLATVKRIKLDHTAFEIYLLILIHVGFYLLPLLIGFTLYFAILHSGKVLHEEYDYLKSRSDRMTVQRFIRMLVPYSLLSLFGAAIIAVFAYYEILPVSMGLLVLVLISVLTLPHSVVMDIFYSRYLERDTTQQA